MPAGFDIRTEWRRGGFTPESRTRRSRGGITAVYLHWPGAPGSLRSINTLDDEIQWMRDTWRFHTGPQRNWSDFAYNHAIFLSGRVHRGRGLDFIPAAQQNFNTTGLAIVCVLGATDAVSAAMRENLIDYVRWAERACGHDLRVRGHQDVNQTTCPGPALMREVPRLSRL